MRTITLSHDRATWQEIARQIRFDLNGLPCPLEAQIRSITTPGLTRLSVTPWQAEALDDILVGIIADRWLKSLSPTR